MKWTEATWFRNLCMGIACVFFSQIVQPMALGFAPLQPAAASTKTRTVQQILPGIQFQSQVSSLMEEVKAQLQELEVLPKIENLTKQRLNDAASCTTPDANPLTASTVSTIPPAFTSLSLPSVQKHGLGEIKPAFGELVSSEQVYFSKRKKTDSDSLSIRFLEWLSSLMISEAHAQTPDPNLESTPDSNTTDLFIMQKAQELSNDPNQIFSFVRDEIGYESYRGSLRGARGTLWSKAGNALDQASLLIALLRASGIPARYVQGTLSDATSQQLILSMFPNPTRVVGCPPVDVERAEPANDPQLLAETREHYWVELDTGSGFTPADPTVPNAQLGDAFAVSEGAFTEVPDDLRHKVAVRLNVEFNNSFTGGLKDPKTVLDQTFTTVEIVGHPLSIGHFVNTKVAGGLVFTTTTHTYSPYILIGQNDSNIFDDELIRGQDYQELFSNFAFSTTFLTGVFLEMDVVELEDEYGQEKIRGQI